MDLDHQYSVPRRSIEGQIVNPLKQLRLTLVFIGGGILLIGSLSVLLMMKIQHEIVSLDHIQNVDPEIIYPILQSVRRAQLLVTVVSFLAFVVAVWRGLRLSHRIWGPMIPLRRHVGELTKGNFKSRVHLRTGDEFTELSDDLNGLAESLEIRLSREPAR